MMDSSRNAKPQAVHGHVPKERIDRSYCEEAQFGLLGRLHMTRPRRLRAGFLAPDYVPPRHHARLPPDRAASLPWLIAPGVIVTPFARRGGGLSDAEIAAVTEMKRLLVVTQLPQADTFWVTSAGAITPLPSALPNWVAARMRDFLIGPDVADALKNNTVLHFEGDNGEAF
jgi:hypothetical protein